MKRSVINRYMEETKALLKRNNIVLPPFAYWSPEDWKSKGAECDEIRKCMLGWDITDFGSGDFDRIGLVVFTVRNGHDAIKEFSNKTYCEKILIMREKQVIPMHFHWKKTEDIINICGGDLIFEVFNSTKSEKLDNTPVTISMDGVKSTVPSGSKITLKPGESMTVPDRLYHAFWAENNPEPLLCREVSKVNDDNTDNRFLEPAGRFPEIEEDVAPLHYLCTEYPG
jgi:hypothetical protein